jgi:hypothetical protein
MSIGNLMAKVGAPKKPAKDVKHVTAIRMKSASKAALKKASADDSRTSAAMAEKIIEDWLKANGYLK